MVLHCEARGEPHKGKLAVIDAIRNRAEHYGEPLLLTVKRGMCSSGKLEPELVELVARALESPPKRKWRYWLNPETSTDFKWVEYALRQDGRLIGRHWFF